MNENDTTHVVGYFNPHNYPIFIEISEINLKAELAPKAYVRDRGGRLINDPVFEPYCHKQGLSRSVSENQVPLIAVPKFVKPQRQPVAVTQATGFVRDGNRTVPTYAPIATEQREIAPNKAPITGMTMDAARKLGFVGKPRLVSEDYGIDETSGAPARGQKLPDIKISIESPPRLKAAQVTKPQSVETLTAALAAPKIAESVQIAQSPPPRPVPLKAPSTPTEAKALPVAPISPKTKTRVTKGTKPTPIQTRRVATPVTQGPPETAAEPAPTPPVKSVAIQPIRVDPEPEPEAEPEAEMEPVIAGSGVVQPLDEGEFPPPTLDAPPTDPETGNSYICAADGKSFQHRSDLLRHIETEHEDMVDALMAPYPTDSPE